MGQQGTHTENGASVLVIDQACDNDQLLVSLSKNKGQWLSPVGWTDQQKVTLLDCRPNGETTEIDIPAEFAGDIKTGDILVLRCSELDLEKEIVWEASEVETRSAEEPASMATGLAGGLLSRFIGSKAEVIEETRSETEIRAEEAGRAAQNFKVKMEAATAAKEEAQRKALDAAREAEAALKMEADRIAEMERAAKAFEEAERLKQDELRRVDEERRAEEARLAEEARRIEAARKRKIAAKKEAERKAALERYQAALDITRDEEIRLKARLKDLKREAKSEAANVAIQAEGLNSRRGYLMETEEAVGKRFDSYEKNASELDVINAELAMLQTESETLGADRQALSIRLSQADADYLQAQTEAEAAMSRANNLRSELDIIRQEDSDVSGKMSSVSERLTSQSQIVADASEKTQKLHLKYEAAQAELRQAKTEIEVLEQSLAVEAEKDQNLRLEVEATQQAVEDSQAREINHRAAIDHLEAGGAPEGISDTLTPRRYEAEGMTTSDTPAPKSIFTAHEDTETGFFNRVRRSFTREKDVELSIDVEDVLLDAADTKVDPVLLAGLDDTPSFVRRHGSSLMTLGAVIGGIAILGGGYAINKSANPILEVKSTAPAPTQVASAVTKVGLPKTAELEAVEDIVVQEVKGGVETKTEIPAVVEADLPDAKPITEEAILASEVEGNSLVVKLAKVVDPTGFAFELPDMMPIAHPKKVDVKPVVIKAKLEKTIVTKTASVEKVKLKAAPKVDAVVNYPELTSDIQARLLKLGFYNGEIDGLRGKTTKEAITNFKKIFSMPEVDDKITGAFLTELKRVEHDRNTAEMRAQHAADIEAQAAIQVAEAAPSVEFYDTVQAVPTAPVVTDSLPAADTYIPVSDPTPAYVEPEPELEPVKLASIPAITEPAPIPVAQDVIVEAKVTKNASAKYPSSAERRNYYVNIAIVVAYDIDISGRAANIRVESNDHTGKYNDAFEKEAVNAIKKLRYEPKTVNGTAVVSEGEQKRIVFRTE